MTRHNWTQTIGGAEPVIVILGMTGHHRLLEVQLKFSSSWVIRANARLTYGTVSIAKNVFFQEHLLDQLARINAATTLVPLHFGVEDNTLNLEVEVWARHAKSKNHPCTWKLVEERAGYAQYLWQHRDVWSYEHEGNNHITNGYYKASCVTRNYVEITTANKNKSLNIKVRGTVELEMDFKSGSSEWSEKSSANWDALVAVVTEAGALKVREIGHVFPVIEKSHTEGLVENATSHREPKAILQECLPQYIDFSDVLRELRAFEGIWQHSYPGTYGYTLANPGFNNNGDIIFEARPAGLQVPVATGTRQLNAKGLRSPSGNLPRSSAFLRSSRSVSRTTSHTSSPSSPMAMTPGGQQNGSPITVETHALNGYTGITTEFEEKVVEKASFAFSEQTISSSIPSAA